MNSGSSEVTFPTNAEESREGERDLGTPLEPLDTAMPEVRLPLADPVEGTISSLLRLCYFTLGFCYLPLTRL